MAKKINWAGVLIVALCVAGIWYISSGYEDTVSGFGTLRLVDETGTLWIEGEDEVWYIPTSPLAAEFCDGAEIFFTGTLKRGDIAQTRAKYLPIEIQEIRFR